MTAGPRLPPGFTLVSLDAVDSTNTQARRLAAKGAADSTVVWARRQQAGRGRQGRAWVSEPGNLYCSAILRPRVAAAAAAQLTFVAALAVADAVAGWLPGGRQIGCKWPNDVQVDGRKIAGILLEAQFRPDGGVDWIVVGMGVNVARFPDAVDNPATALWAEGATAATAEQVLGGLCGALQDWRATWEKDGFEPVRRAWINRAVGIGEAIRVRLPRQTLHGTFRTIDQTGAMVLDRDGTETLITAGDVFFDTPRP